jgi:acetyl esterase/lipase
MDDISVTNGTKLDISRDNVHWRKSSRSNFSGNCVEIATAGGSAIGASAVNVAVLVRDSKNPGPVVQFDPGRWTAFLDYVKKVSL